MTLDEFLIFEKKNACETLSVGDFHYWWFIRCDLMSRCGCSGYWVQEDIGQEIKEERKASQKKSYFRRKTAAFINLFKIIFAEMRYSPFIKGKKNSLFIFQDALFYNPMEQYYECPRTQFIVKNWEGKKTIISNYFAQKYCHAFPYQFKETAFYILPAVFGWNLIWQRREREQERKQEIEKSILPVLKDLDIKYGCSVETKEIVERIYYYYKIWKTHYKYFERLIKYLKPCGAIETWHYSPYKMVFNEVAKKYHVPVIEAQHGVMGRNHEFYNSYIMAQPAFPDYILTFSDFWKKCTRFPLPDDHIISAGYPYLENKVLKSRAEKKEISGRRLLVIEGDHESDKGLRKFLIDVCEYVRLRKISDFKIIFKLHPEARIDYLYEEVCKEFSQYQDIIKVLAPKEMNLYDCFMVANEQISLRSTGLFEGMAYGLKTYIYKDKDTKYFENDYPEDLCNSGYALLVEKPEQLFEFDADNMGKNADEFWVQNSQKVQIQAIKDILKREGMLK